MAENYVTIMVESLEKKSKKLDEILATNREQAAVLKKDEFLMDEFDQLVDEKETLIQALSRLDVGFEKLYENVKEELISEAGKIQYAAQIKKMQQLISEISEKSISIQAQEQRNKTAVEIKFRQEREKIRSGKVGSKVALDYYKTASNTNYAQSHFMDEKN